MSLRGPIRFLFFFLLFLLATDGLFFRYWLWKIPDEAAWETESLYNFEYAARRLASEKPKGEFRILIVGSSLGRYAVLPSHLEKILQKENPRIHVSFFSHQGMNAMQLRALTDRLLEARPDLVVYPANMVDFRLERPFVLGLMGDLATTGERRKRALETLKRDLIEMQDYGALAPRGLLRTQWASLALHERAALFLKRFFAFYRYRDFVPVPLRLYLENRFSRGHSYLHYAGIPVGGGGVTRRGWTSTYFSLRLTQALLKRGLDLEAPKELFDAAAGKNPYLAIRRGDCSETDFADGIAPDSRRMAVVRLRREWQNIRLAGFGFRTGERLCFRVGPAGFHSDLEDDILAVRLARNTGREVPLSYPVIRDVRREDDLYKNYTDAECRRSFEERILRFDRSGMEYLQSLQIAKRGLAPLAFDATLPSIHDFDLWRKRMRAARIPLLVVNMPENPVSLAWYENARWYNGYLRFLAGGPGGSDDAGYRMEDRRNLLPIQMFYDYHHLTYWGALRFTEDLSGMIQIFLKKQADQHRGPGGEHPHG